MGLDTGATDDFYLDEQLMPSETCRSTLSSDVQSVIPGASVIRQRVGLSQARLGDVSLGPVLVQFLSHERAAGLDLNGVVGLGALSRYNFAIDMAGQRFAIYGPSRYERSGGRPTIGIQYRPMIDRLVVIHLETNSPASKSGIQVGDAICAISGKPVAGFTGTYDLNTESGNILKISLCGKSDVQIRASDFLKPTVVANPDRLAPFPSDFGWFTQAFADCIYQDSQIKLNACQAVIDTPFQLGAVTDYRSAMLLVRAKYFEKINDAKRALEDYRAAQAMYPANVNVGDNINRLNRTNNK